MALPKQKEEHVKAAAEHAQAGQSKPAKQGTLAAVKKNAYIILPILIILAGIFLVSTMNSTIAHNKTEEAKSKAELSAKVYSSLLSDDIDKAVGVTNTLERHVVNGNGSLPRFNQMAQGMMASYIQSIQLAPGGVVTQIYPAEGNEAGLIDLIDRDDERGESCRYARDNDTVVMQGPFDLLQGGSGIAIRNPVFLEQDGQKTFWGFTIVIVRVPDLFESSIATLSGQGYDYRLSKTASPTSSEYVEVCGSSDIFDDALVHDFEAAGISWRLEVYPQGGWYNPASNTMTTVVNMAFFISLAIIVFLLLRHNLRKEEQKRLVMAGNIERLESERALKDQVQMYATAMGVEYPLAVAMDYLGKRYRTIEGSNALSKISKETGSIDDFLEEAVGTIPDEEQAAQFAELFGRKQVLDAFRSGETEVAFTHTQRGDDGQVHWMETKVVCVECSEHQVRGVMLFKCIDEEVRNKQLRIEAERANAAKTNFLRRMSHDVRTPINGIRGEVLIAQSNYDDLRLQEQCRQKIMEASDYLLTLVNNILDMSKLESGVSELAHEPFDLGEVLSSLNSLTEAQAVERGIAFKVEGSASDIQHRCLVGSWKHLQQILSNLATNAVKYNRPGGTVAVSCRELSSDGSSACFEFMCADTGIGMSKGFQERMYDAFAQEERDENVTAAGSGLGLAIVHELVEQMGGTIECESAEGSGTVFRVRLQFDLNLQEEPSGESAVAEGSAGVGKRALLVEDNDLNREIACFVLEQEGLTVECARNGKLGVDAFADSPKGYYDIVFMDVMMPVMDGLDATRAIRALDREDARCVPIVAMTANAFIDDINRSMEAGMNDHLVKPIEPDRIHESIQRLLG